MIRNAINRVRNRIDDAIYDFASDAVKSIDKVVTGAQAKIARDGFWKTVDDFVLSNGIMKEDPNNLILGRKFNKPIGAAILSTGGILGYVNGRRALNTERIEAMQREFPLQMSPIYARDSQMNNLGATADLVFAMRNLRHG
jgi:hypothetical protein